MRMRVLAAEEMPPGPWNTEQTSRATMLRLLDHETARPFDLREVPSPRASASTGLKAVLFDWRAFQSTCSVSCSKASQRSGREELFDAPRWILLGFWAPRGRVEACSSHFLNF